MSIHATTRNEARNITPGKLGIRDLFQDDRRPDAFELRALPTRDLVGEADVCEYTP